MLLLVTPPYHLVYGKVGRGPVEILRDSWTGDVDQTDTLLISTQKYLDKLKLDTRIQREYSCIVRTVSH